MSSTSLQKLLRPVSVDKSGGSLTWILLALVRTHSLGEIEINKSMVTLEYLGKEKITNIYH